MKHYSFILVLLLFLFSNHVANATIVETFEHDDINAIKADISKYFIVKGAQISNGSNYASNTLNAIDKGRDGRNAVIKNFVFNFYPFENDGQLGTKVEMTLYTTIPGSKTVMASIVDETTEMERIKASMKGKFLYGLGFEFDNYDTPLGKIKAAKGKYTGGVKLTLVRYDALNKGLQAGDLIVEVNGMSIEDIPIEQFAEIFFAKSLTDEITLTVKRGKLLKTVTLTPRQSTRKVF